MLAIANVEYIEATPFLVIALYDRYLIDAIIEPFESIEGAVERLHDVVARHGQTAIDVWTSNRDLFAALLQTPGLNGIIKHPDDTRDTLALIKQYESILYEVHDIEPIIKRPPLPKWRRFLLALLLKLENLIKGEGKYDCEI
ncbi:hypothetical protein PTHTG4_09870 [Parageobacillus thermoglucosidasius]|uniref:hypothetical protein n=1 Tax=Parageobacillus thermoglucosidasius TaxID=1426 RepID=UPI000F6273EE|nr:hypothetical protein [Parageobacillus thermoglucosidasius]GCD81925.1 hypothetical protein PTHTG4_09870 [Parageobacillus thermoglucosidasius]